MRHQAKVAALAGAKHQAMCAKANRLTKAIDRLVMNLERGHPQPQKAGAKAPSDLDTPTIAPAISLGKNAFRKGKLAFKCHLFMFLSEVLDAVARIVGISVRGRKEIANFICARGR